jgi:hypothetical protein
MSEKLKVLVLEDAPNYKLVGAKWWVEVDLLEKYPIRNTNWEFIADPMKMDIPNRKRITMILDSRYDPWQRPLIPWQWAQHHSPEGWMQEASHEYIGGTEKYPYERRYSSVEGVFVSLFRRSTIRSRWKT